MLELFSIFTKGGIVLFYFQGACTQLISSTQAVNESIKNILVQVCNLVSVASIFSVLSNYTVFQYSAFTYSLLNTQKISCYMLQEEIKPSNES